MIIQAKRPVGEERELRMLEVGGHLVAKANNRSIEKVDSIIIYARVTLTMPWMG
jgi:hypothetical protein